MLCFLSFTELSGIVGDKMPQVNKCLTSGLFLICNTRQRIYPNCDKIENRCTIIVKQACALSSLKGVKNKTKQPLANRASQFNGIAFCSAIASLNSLCASEEQVLFQQLSEGLARGYTILDRQVTL